VHSLLNICDDGCRAPTVRKGNRPGVGSLAPGEDYHQEYSALMLTLDRRYADGWSLKGSYTWSKSKGLLPRPQIQSQGSTLYGSLDGTDPNEWLNAEQYLQNDRTHVFRVQGYVDLPWTTQASMSANWQTGRPYARLDRVSSRFLDQGSQFIIIDPASNDHRLPTSLLIDLGLRKNFALGNDMSLEVGLDVFNILNEDANTSWDSQWVGPDEEYTASNYVWPRRAMVRLGLKF
jgi:hypothetical protein